jgi:cytochrome c biogenesis factor
MYPLVLGAHNLVRWLVILAGLYVVIRAWRSWLFRSPWSAVDLRAGALFVRTLDVQILIGIVLYAFVSPLTRQAFADVGGAMRDPAVRYFFVEHVVVMLVAAALAHIGAVKVRRAKDDASRAKTAAIWYGLSIAAILGFVPWQRPWIPSF